MAAVIAGLLLPALPAMLPALGEVREGGSPASGFEDCHPENCNT